MSVGVATTHAVNDALGVLFAALPDDVPIILRDPDGLPMSVASAEDLATALAHDPEPYVDCGGEGVVAFVYQHAEGVDADAWRSLAIEPTMVLAREERGVRAELRYFVFDQPQPSAAVSGLASALGSDLSEPVPLPGSNGWELVHFGEAAFDLADLAALGTYGDAVIKAPFSENDPALLREIVVTVGSNSKSTHWKPTKMPLGGMVAMLCQHKVGKKDGLAWVLGDMVGGQRNIKAVRSLTAVGLDIDTGMSSEAIDAELKKLGCLAIRYTTHSHMRGAIEVPKDTIARWVEKNRSGADLTADATIRDFLHEFKHYEREIADTAKFIDWDHTGSGIVAKISHDPMPKNRVVLPLLVPFEIANEGASQKEAEAKWRKIPAALARLLGGIPLDKTGSDPNRLFYLPRHDEGAEFEVALFGGQCLDWRGLELDDPWEVLSEELGSPSATGTVVGPFDRRWAARRADGFQIVDLIRDHAPERIRSDHGEKLEIECPFDDEHSNAGDPEDRACMARNGDSGFVITCRHEGCQDHDRLAMLNRMVAQGWFEAEDAMDDQYDAIDRSKEEIDASRPGSRRVGAVAVGGVLDSLGSFDPKWRVFDGPNAENDAINALGSVVSVLSQGNKTRIAIRTRNGMVYNSKSDAMTRFESYRAFVQVGEDAKGQPKIKAVPALKLALESPKVKIYDGIDCDPSNNLPSHILNTWEGLQIAPAEGDCSLLLAHIENSVCAGDQANTKCFLQFLAHMFQKPNEKPSFCPVVIGAKGSGKSTVGDFVCRAIGRKHSIKIAQAKHLTGNFNAHLSGGRLFVLAEEVTFGGDRKGEGALKDTISAKTMLTEPKGLDAYQESNFSRFLLISNPGHAIPASDGERRWLVLHTRDLFDGLPHSHPERRAYFDALHREADDGGIAAFLHYLMNYDITDFDPHGAPHTEALVDQVRQSLSDEDQWLLGVLETGEFDDRDGESQGGDDWELDHDLSIECSVVRASFASHVRRYGGSSGGAGAARKVLEKHGPVSDRRTGEKNGPRQRRYVLGPRREWRERFTKRYGIGFTDDGA